MTRGQNDRNHCHRTEYRKKNEKSLRDLWDNIKSIYIFMIVALEGEEREGDLKKYLKR